MINKKNMWFLTLFSLILVLSVYYITMPKELLLNNLVNNPKKEVSLEESSVIEALKLEKEEINEKEIESLKETISNPKSTPDKKNEAFKKLKLLDINSGNEEDMNDKIKQEFKYESFTSIDGDNIKVTIKCNKKDKKLANQIMRFVQSKFDTKKYITVEFK